MRHLLGHQRTQLNNPPSTAASTPRYLAEDPLVIGLDSLISASGNSFGLPSSNPIGWPWYSTTPDNQCHRAVELPYRVSLPVKPPIIFTSRTNGSS